MAVAKSIRDIGLAISITSLISLCMINISYSHQIILSASKKGKPKVELSHDELNSVVDYDKMCEQLDLAVEHLKQDYIEQLSLRTSAGMSLSTLFFYV